MKKKRMIIILPFLLILPAILLTIFNFNYNKDFNNIVSNFLVKEGNETDDTEPYTYEQVQMLAVSLRVKEAYNETYKMIPLTCSVNVNRTVKLIYMDGSDQLGYKYINYRKPAGTLMEPSKKGYDFVKWTNKDGDTVDEETVIASDVDYYVYANWNNHISTLTVDPASGTWNNSGDKQNFELAYEETKDIPDPTRTGYNFTSWKLVGEASTIDNRVFKMGYEDTTITAQWSPKTYTLYYDVNGGNPVSPASKSIVYTKEYGDLPTPTRTGYTFEGWYTDANNGTQVNAQTKHTVPNDVTIHAHWLNTPPTEPQFTITYANAPGKSEGMLPRDNGTETITVTISSTDREEKYPTKFNLECTGGGLCKNGNLTISGPVIKDGKAVYTLTAKKMGIGLLKATVNDTPGLSNHNSSVIYVYGPDGQISEDAKYDVYSFNSGWLEQLEGCYISEFEFRVQFGSGHSNGNNDDTMKVTGRTKSGSQVLLYQWTGNMLGTLHVSNFDELTKYNNSHPNDPIVEIEFYTYSPHNGCTPDATIHYSVKYTFDKRLIEE